MFQSLRLPAAALLTAALSSTPLWAADAAKSEPVSRGTFRFAAPAVQFDVSPPLRNIPIKAPPDLNFGDFFGTLMVDPDPPFKRMGPQTPDAAVQGFLGPVTVPPTIQNFNVGTGTANPPDPNGDVGPNHYVRMANASFQIFNKTGTSLFGPANINTLFTGFGGDCETENAGDPIVLYDQLADRWLLTQFSNSTGPGFFNCVALSTSGDPTGTYFRWAFPTGTFPDYPKYGIWPGAYMISTREVNAGLIGAYAIDRAEMIAGNPSPVVISFTVPVNEFSGDGLLPTDLDGDTLPPDPNTAWYIGAMDDGGAYGATQDALTIWEFSWDFVTPTNSSFEVASVLPIAPYDTIFPCDGRSCIPQPAPLGAVDILSYRQRPINRAAYRNFGSYQSIVTNQSVEAAEALGGTRWWEIRDPGADAVLYQDSTFAPGVTDGIHRWMGSIAQDSAGNLGMGYSAGSSALFPSIRYTGRLESDELNTMRGEGVIIDGGGGHTAATRRWGDYTSINIDPTDDCTFWYINEYFASSGTQWTLRAGSFKFPECEAPGGSFGAAAVPLTQAVCAPNDAVYTVETHAYNGFVGAATLNVSNLPPGTTASFAPLSIATVPGNSTLTIGNTGSGTAGGYDLLIEATSGATRSRTVHLDLFTQTPAAPALMSPADASVDTSTAPLLTWDTSTQGQTYVVEIATDAGFANIVQSSTASAATSYQAQPLNFDTQYFWRVRSGNVCGDGVASTPRSFTTRPAPGMCSADGFVRVEFNDDVESGTNGWTTIPASGNAWVRSTANPSSGQFSWFAVDATVTSDQQLISPTISIPPDHTLSLLRFEHDMNAENNGGAACWDGGFVEISTDGGTNWTILESPSLLEDEFFGPLPGGTAAWCGVLPYSTASFDVSSFAGQDVQFRFHMQTDTNTGTAPLGWHVDDIRVVSCGLLEDGFE
ncbi:MAG: hypothetical protein R3F15_19455 [Lysobacterales bacterium]